MEEHMLRGAVSAALLVVLVVLVAGCSSGREAVPPFDETATSNATEATAIDPPATSPSTTVSPETVEDFLVGFVGAYRTGNPVFLIQRIHPDIRDYYGREACREAYASITADDTAKATVRSVTDPAPWSEIFDGVEFSFEDVYAVDVDFIDFDRTRREDLQVARVGDRFYYFPDCGDPVAATTPTVDVALVDPDGDGFYYVHGGAADSEDFQVPAIFRITYTGSSSTCSFQLLDSATGAEVIYVTGLEGGGMKRIVLSEQMSSVYVSDVLGCSGGEVQIGPNP
jgi:hypothetical protein